MTKTTSITVKDTIIRTLKRNGVDYICITDIARQKNPIDPNGVIGNWMRNRNTVEFLGLWETLNNPHFNPLEFEGFRKEAGLNSFTLLPTRWTEATNAMGLISLSGRYGGTYALLNSLLGWELQMKYISVVIVLMKNQTYETYNYHRNQ